MRPDSGRPAMRCGNGPAARAACRVAQTGSEFCSVAATIAAQHKGSPARPTSPGPRRRGRRTQYFANITRVSRQRILVVEDEPAIADTIVYALASDGFEPQWCATGGAALETARAGNFALAVLDVGLPDINGFELFKQLQQGERPAGDFLDGALD